MTTEAVKWLLQAEGEKDVLRKVGNVNDGIESQTKRVKEVGGQAKASTELVGSLANSLGGSEIGQFSGEMAQLTERISAFTEVSKAGGKGALFFKAGIVGAAGVIGFKLGRAIRELIPSLKGVRKEWSELTEDFDSASRGGLSRAADAFADFKERASLLGDAADQDAAFDKMLTKMESRIAKAVNQVEAQKERIDSLGITAGSEEKDNQNAVLQANKDRLAMLREQRDELQKALSPQQKELELMREKAAMRDASESFVKGLEREVEQLSLSEKAFAELTASRETRGPDQDRARELTNRKFQLLEEKRISEEKEAAEKKAATERDRIIKKELSDRQRLADFQQSTLENLQLEAVRLGEGETAANALRLQMQGLDKDTAETVAGISAGLDKLSNKDQEKSTPSLGGQEQRLATGRGETQQNKLLQQTTKTTNENVKANQKLDDILAELTAIKEKESTPLLVKGD